ncbi:hypothetical protein ACQCX2_06870 [Propionibacteriaceae bacterium Y1700]|uniref:hypothetical protein n=1 Tax=Microlunatus sp. Y1700 TaxID=3418487 RepID=UPI003DA785A9
MRRRSVLAGAVGLTAIGAATATGTLMGLKGVLAKDTVPLADRPGHGSLSYEWDDAETVTSRDGLVELGAIASVDGATWVIGKKHLADLSGIRPCVFRRDGDQWTEIPHPIEQDGVFTDIAVIAPDDVWAVGAVEDAAPVALHWDGSAWTQKSVPTKRKCRLIEVVIAQDKSVWATSWAAKGDRVIRLDGDAPQELDPGLDSRDSLRMWGGAATDLWCAADSGLSHYDGQDWHRADEGPPTEGVPQFLAGSGLDDMWCVGAVGLDTRSRAFALHHDGRAWVEVPVPDGIALLNHVVVREGLVVALGQKWPSPDDPMAASAPYVLELRDGRFVEVTGPAVEINGVLGEILAAAFTESELWVVGQADGSFVSRAR